VREGSKSKGKQPSSLAKVLKKKFSGKDLLYKIFFFKKTFKIIEKLA